MDFFGCHASVLSPGIRPHPPHSHREEEILIPLSGTTEILMSRLKPEHTEIRKKIERGDFVYYPSHQFHTIHNTSKAPVTYLMLKWWVKEASNKEGELETRVFRYGNEIMHFSEPEHRLFFSQIFDCPTRYLQKLSCHVTTLQPGGGYPPHSDEYDVALVLLKGKVETMGLQVESPGVIFYAAGNPHGIKNLGKNSAFYLVFEFHNE